MPLKMSADCQNARDAADPLRTRSPGFPRGIGKLLVRKLQSKGRTAGSKPTMVGGRTRLALQILPPLIGIGEILFPLLQASCVLRDFVAWLLIIVRLSHPLVHPGDL